HRPLNAAQVAFCSDAMVNMLPLNSTFVVANAIRDMRDDKPASMAYGRMDEARMHELVRRGMHLSGPPMDADMPSQHWAQASATMTRPKHIVVIVEESLGAQFVGCLGGRDLTPCLDELAGQGWLLARNYATGTRSVRGLEAIVSGFLPTPADAVVKLPRSQRDFFTLAALLGQFGYHSRFIYGGEAHFDNMKGFFLGNGFDTVIDRPKFMSRPGFVGSWGASDEDMFEELHQRLSADGDTPTLSVAFSVSNHSPWEYPEGRIEPQGCPASVDNTVRYADWAIGQFFQRARTSAYWDDTVFLVVADHDARVCGASLVPVQHFHIPALFLGGSVKPGRSDGITSQIDLAPTLLSLAGVSCVHPMPGVDLTRCQPQRAIMQYGDNHGYLKNDRLLVMEPQRPSRQFACPADHADMHEQVVDEALAEEALAHALWPGWAYFNQRYRIPDTQPGQQAVTSSEPEAIAAA
ncbi:MAG TPA: LTA synthase family protein, partial [Rhodanobacteraceae bacterium]|nr:LTA synthase family protein [Rhodanobacteraceae bacterium]